KPGDVVLTNDPWIGTGHRHDTTVVTPIFYQERLIGFAGSVAHKSDVGGLLRSAEGREVFEEGIGIPPLKLYSGGELNETIVSLVYDNVRSPDEFMGDLHAQVASGAVCARKVVEFLEEQNLESLIDLCDSISDRAETVMREAILRVL